jgi:regulator of sigma E protease
VGDPLSLPYRLAARAGQTVRLSLRRDDKQIELPVQLRATERYERPSRYGHSVTVPSLGVAYALENQVAGTEPGSPAEKKVKPGERIVKVVLLPPEAAVQKKLNIEKKQKKATFHFNSKRRDWPLVFYTLQELLPGTKVQITLKNDRRVTLDPRPVERWYNPQRGFVFEPLHVINKAESIPEALALGLRETRESLTMVFRFLRKIGSQVSVRGMGGPITIAWAAGHSATQGIPELLRFLAMLSANLAVINFLPIPLLDGGHMVFLTIEGIRGKPVSEKVVVAFHYAGFLFIITLMLFVLALDFGLISRAT